MPMNECTNDSVRDILPLLASGGQVPASGEVERHIARCEACREELAVLMAARQALLRGPVVDVARIAAAVPAYRSSPVSDPKVVPIAPRRSPLRSWRVAAAALIVAAAGTALAVVETPDGAAGRSAVASSRGAGGSGSPAGVGGTDSIADTRSADGGGPPAVGVPEANGGGVEMTFGGGLGDLSDEELVALLASPEEETVLAPAEPDEMFPNMTIEEEI